jgi:hypothetical protein
MSARQQHQIGGIDEQVQPPSSLGDQPLGQTHLYRLAQPFQHGRALVVRAEEAAVQDRRPPNGNTPLAALANAIRA